jgi:hypothetical protein
MPFGCIVKTLVHLVMFRQVFALNPVLTRRTIHDGEFPGVLNEE